MDAKALAKSKRAHSQHHSKKSHFNQKPRASSDGTAKEAGSDNKQLGKQVKARIYQSPRIPGLPSNWDRYEDEVDNAGGSSVETANLPSDVIFPKSKGADFRHLIEEAQSQSQSYVFLDNIPSLDDVLPGDFNYEVGSMVAVRGESILSWIGGDSFVVEEKTIPGPEAPFLSLNLHALAEQLAKIDLSERLFIERDLLPQEPSAEGKTIIKELTDQIQTIDLEDDVVISGQASHGEFSSFVNREDQIPNKKLPTFEPAAVEELGMLLSLLSENNKHDSNSSTSYVHEETSLTRPLQLPRNIPISSSELLVASNLDDALDDLLEETSNLMPHKENAVHSDIQSFSSPSGTNSNTLDDDFDSWLDTIS